MKQRQMVMAKKSRHNLFRKIVLDLTAALNSLEVKYYSTWTDNYHLREKNKWERDRGGKCGKGVRHRETQSERACIIQQSSLMLSPTMQSAQLDLDYIWFLITDDLQMSFWLFLMVGVPKVKTFLHTHTKKTLLSLWHYYNVCCTVFSV